MSMRPNLRIALREAATLFVLLLVGQAVLLALGRATDWWGFVAMAAATIPVRFAMALRDGARSKPEGTRLPRSPESPTP